jgi:hypothetical protein
VNISERKLFELRQKLESLESEFKHWRDKSEANNPLQKHHTQIRRVTYQLQGIQSAILNKLNDLGKSQSEDILSQARELELDILEVHRIWEFFRSKFALRSVDWFNPYLVAADEFAWACYQVAQQSLKKGDLVRNDLKQPPLVFFNGGSSPYTLPRNLTYEAENVPGEELRTSAANLILKELPIPVIGIPWFQVQHLPEALVIGHEVGHDVEEDFQLTDRIESLLEEGMTSVHKERRPAWRAWLRETFADLYGNLATGPAFVESLLDFLATDKQFTETDRRTAPAWGDYPTDYLRILINLEVLKEQGFEDESERLKNELTNIYKTHAMPEFVDDIPKVVKALLDGPYPEFDGKSLKEIISFTKANHKSALSDCGRLLDGKAPTTNSIRILLAAARLAYGEDPEKYKSKDVHNLILKQVPATQAKGVRGVRGSEDAELTKPAELSERDAYDKATGESLYEKVRLRVGK